MSCQAQLSPQLQNSREVGFLPASYLMAERACAHDRPRMYKKLNRLLRGNTHTPPHTQTLNQSRTSVSQSVALAQVSFFFLSFIFPEGRAIRKLMRKLIPRLTQNTRPE